MAIAHTATLPDAMEVCELMEDERHGISRDYLPWALIHCPVEAVVDYLTPITDHPHMGKTAKKVIKQAKSLAKKKKTAE